ncbi:hypothetical protein M9H77_29920 [Catharanthus roseus]|uniref:Uncharacterized protein n=1 Tax=Catharanthus roseus TaxID=4058 RepID=A0ACC0A007_CATRO|nr:hypothetical protein M9H77_29920 [Catharanthus roseus]
MGDEISQKEGRGFCNRVPKMTQTLPKMGLPYSLVLTFIMEALEVNRNGEKVDEPTTYFEKKNLSGIKWQREKVGKDMGTWVKVRDENREKNWEQDQGDNEEEGECQHDEEEVGYGNRIAMLEREMKNERKDCQKQRRRIRNFGEYMHAEFSKFEVVEESDGEVQQSGDDGE